MSKKPDIPRLFEFQQLLLEFSQIERVVHRKHRDSYIQESDTEHSYNLAMTAWFLAPYFSHLDKDELIRFALAHDIVEVHAGDTYVFADQELIDSKPVREAAALKQLQDEWPDFPELIGTIHAYEQKSTEEAKFVYALDKIMPVFVIYMNEGHTWKLEGLTVERLHAAKKDKVKLSKDIQAYYDKLYQLLLNSPHLIPKA
jgi:putative hydrolase of HD superfamily